MGRINYPIYDMENKSHVPNHQPELVGHDEKSLTMEHFWEHQMGPSWKYGDILETKW